MATTPQRKKEVSNEPDRRNNHGEPLCDDCGMVVVDRQNSDFGGSCLCHDCQAAYRALEDTRFKYATGGVDE